MNVNVSQERATLERLTMRELRARFAELFGEVTLAGNRTWLVRRILWRLQALAQGDLSERARQRAALLANDADLRLLPPRAPRAARPSADVPAPAPEPPAALVASPRHGLPPIGSELVRLYKGQRLVVQVRADGFAYQGTVYASLSAVAQAITGSHWNGRLFFGLKNQGGDQ